MWYLKDLKSEAGSRKKKKKNGNNKNLVKKCPVALVTLQKAQISKVKI